MKRLLPYALVLAAAVFPLSACSLIPAEDEPLPAPMLRPYEREELTFAAVRRDDLIQTKTVSCRSRPVREESYGFKIGGEYISRVYVSVGDAVKAGDILAELERRDILAQIEDARIVMQKQELELELAKDEAALLREERRIELAGGGEAELLAVREDHAFDVSYAEKRLEIAASKFEILSGMAEDRVIYAGIDGVVSYAQRFAPDDRSVANERVFVVSDASELVYSVTGEDALFFTPGDTYSMKLSRALADVVAATPEEFGEASGDEPVIYFVPQDLTAGLASYGYITVETDRRDAALYLPSAAVIKVGDGYAAYRVGDSGLRELAPVEAGVIIGGKREIISGVSEGDEVILD